MSNDLISRQAAIDAIEWGKTYLSVFDKDGNVSRPFEVANNELLNAIDRIKEIPSAQDWMPVTERLPEKQGYYFVTYEWRSEKFVDYETGIDWFRGGEWVETPRNYKVVAWMPLPEPYKEATNE